MCHLCVRTALTLGPGQDMESEIDTFLMPSACRKNVLRASFQFLYHLRTFRRLSETANCPHQDFGREQNLDPDNCFTIRSPTCPHCREDIVGTS